MAATKVICIFIFWCSIGITLDVFSVAYRATQRREVLDSSRKDKQIFSGKHAIKSLKVERRRNSDSSDSSNTTATPPKTIKASLAPAIFPSPKPFNITCSGRLSCKGRCQQERARGTKNLDEDYCYCDPYCDSFKDCCADFDQFCEGVVPTQKLDDHWGCHDGIWMIDSCPRKFNSLDVIIKCASSDKPSASNYADVTPVTSKTGKTYKNKHCALCNGVRKQDIKSLGYSFNNCQLTPPLNYNVKQKLQFLIDNCITAKLETTGEQRVRKCLELTENAYSCSKTTEKRACKRGPYRIVFSISNRNNFKNAHCSRCEGISDDNIRCGPLRFPKNGMFGPHVKPFTAIFDIDITAESDKSMNTVASCGDGQVYDIFLETCRKGLQFPVNKYSPKLNKYTIAMWIQIRQNNKLLTIQNYPTKIIFDALSKHFGLKSQFFEFVERENMAAPSIVVLVANLYIEKNTMTKTPRPNSSHDINMLLNFSRPFEFRFYADNFRVLKATSRLLTCVRVEYFTSEDYVVVQGSSSIYINHTQELLTEKEYFANSTTISNGYQISVGAVAVCRQHLPSTSPCNGTYISLDKDEYVMLPNNSVYRNASNTVYNQGQYSIINGSVLVCTEYSNKYTKTQQTGKSQDDTALRILTCIGLSLSVVCLVIVLVTYLLFGELRTLPGINLMNLSSALLVAHFFWLIGSGQTDSHGACVAIAVILHFAFLASFAWMSIIAFTTWKAFSSTGCASRSSDKQYRKRKICYSLALGWLPVLVLVLVCLTLDQSGAVEIGYGGPKGCWVNNGLANIFIFILPLGASVIWNAVFFGLTVKAIYKAKKQARMVTEQRENKRNFSIYVKIAVLMGFTWIFGFLALLQSTYFSYPFVVFNTIQGVYIAVAFTFNARVKKLYQMKFTSSRKSDRSTNKYVKHSTENTRV